MRSYTPAAPGRDHAGIASRKHLPFLHRPQILNSQDSGIEVVAMPENFCRLYRIPAEHAGRHDLNLIGATLRDAAGKIAGHVEPVGSVDIVLSDRLDSALACLKVYGGHSVELRYLMGGLLTIGSQLTELGELARQQASRLAGVQQRIDFLVKKWEESLAAKIRTLLSILRLADKKTGGDARCYIERNHFPIDESINIFESYISELQTDLPDSSYFHVEILRQILLVSKLRAKIFFLLGDPQEASDNLNTSSARVETDAKRLLREWTKGVDLRDIAPNGPDELNNLLMAMEQIDSVGRYERLCTMFYELPRLPERANLAPLHIIPKDISIMPSIQDRKFIYLEHLNLARKGDIFGWNNENCVIADKSGYFVLGDPPDGRLTADYCSILEIPAPRPATRETGDHIRTLARLVIEAQKLRAEGVIAKECPIVAQEFNNLCTLADGGPGHGVLLLMPPQNSVALSPSDGEIFPSDVPDVVAKNRE